MRKPKTLTGQAAANARWFKSALCYLHWATDAGQPPADTLALLAADIAALAQEDHHAPLRCLDYSLYAIEETRPPKALRRKRPCKSA